MQHTPKALFIFAAVESANFAPVPGVGAGVSSVRGILSSSGVSRRAAAALLLNADHNPEVLKTLESALGATDWTVHAAAVDSIALRNDSALESDLIPLFLKIRRRWFASVPPLATCGWKRSNPRKYRLAKDEKRGGLTKYGRSFQK
jgi:hypothetical protein